MRIMPNPGFSLTAAGAAAQRALHMQVDDEPRIFEEPYAVRLLTPNFYRPGIFGLPRRPKPPPLERLSKRPRSAANRIRAQIVTRSRYAEDSLSSAIHAGVSQYVMLAAGFDSFAQRRTDLLGDLNVFEIDQPPTQLRV